MTLFRRLQAVHRHFYEKSVQRKSLTSDSETVGGN